MKKERITSICNLVCALLLLVTLIVQFLPFWTCSDCKTHKGVDKEVSIAEYLWTPKHHEPIADEMTDLYRELYGSDYRDPATGKKFKFQVNAVLPAMLTVFLGSVAGLVGCLIFRKRFFMTAIPLTVGIAGIVGHLTYPALKVGHNAQLHLIVFVVVAAVSAIALTVGTIAAIQRKRAKKMEKAHVEPVES